MTSSIGSVWMNFTPSERHCPMAMDMFQYLKMLADVGLSTQLKEEIENIYQNHPNITEKLSGMLENQTKLSETFYASNQKDDFAYFFQNPVFKTIYVIYLFVVFLFNTTFNALLIHYEKYGGDPMKRSLRNQLIAQTGYASNFMNLLVFPMWTFRTLFGPVNRQVAWAYLCLLESTKTWLVM